MSKTVQYTCWFYNEILKGWVNCEEDRLVTDKPNHIVTWEFEQKYPNKSFRLDADNIAFYYSNGYFKCKRTKYWCRVWDWDVQGYIAKPENYDGNATIDDVINHFEDRFFNKGFRIDKDGTTLYQKEPPTQLPLF